MGQWRRVMWCSVCMPRECVLIISSRAWWWCGAGRAGGLSFSRSLGDGRRGRSWCVTRKWCARSSGRSTEGRRKDHPEVVRWLGSRRRPPSWRSAVSVAAAAGAGSLWRRASTSKSFVRSLLPPASRLLLPRRRGWLAGGLCGERAPLSCLVRSPFSCPPRVLAVCHPEVRPPK